MTLVTMRRRYELDRRRIAAGHRANKPGEHGLTNDDLRAWLRPCRPSRSGVARE